MAVVSVRADAGGLLDFECSSAPSVVGDERTPTVTTLVTGATGNTGRHVVAELLRRGERVRALTRNPVAAAGRFPVEVELVTGTHTTPERLDAALDGVNRLHITVTAGLAEAGPELVRRAVGAGVRRITVVWGGEVGPVEQAVADSGVEWTRLEPQ